MKSGKNLDLLNLLLNRINIGICLIDKHFIVVQWNHILERWLDIKKENILNTCLFERFPYLEEKNI